MKNRLRKAIIAFGLAAVITGIATSVWMPTAGFAQSCPPAFCVSGDGLNVCIGECCSAGYNWCQAWSCCPTEDLCTPCLDNCNAAAQECAFSKGVFYDEECEQEKEYCYQYCYQYVCN